MPTILNHRIDEVQPPLMPVLWSEHIQLEDVQYLIDEVLPRRDLTFLVGIPKTGKTTLAVQIAWHVATGTPLWGFRVEQGKVLYVLCRRSDGRPPAIKKALQAIGDYPPGSVRIAGPFSGRATAQDRMSALRDEVAGNRPDLIIIDLLPGLDPKMSDPNTYGTLGESLEGLSLLTDKTNAACLGLYHAPKSWTPEQGAIRAISGSVSLAGSCDNAMALASQKQEGTASLRAEGRNIDGKWELGFSNGIFAVDTPDARMQRTVQRVASGVLTDTETEILAILRESPKSANTIHKALGGRWATVATALSVLECGRHVCKTDDGKRWQVAS